RRATSPGVIWQKSAAFRVVRPRLAYIRPAYIRPRPAASRRLGPSRQRSGISVTSTLSFAMLHELCERHPTENEYAQNHEDDEAIRRDRHIFWQAVHSGHRPLQANPAH